MSITGLGRIATAEKMSVNQLKEALQNKTLPGYIAVPLIEEKLDMQKRMAQSNMMQQAQKQPPIADQVMQRAAMEGIDQLPTGLPPTQMAGGGIVAFEDGGEVIHASNGLYADPELLRYIQERETGGIRNPDLAVSPKGAMGRMQIMPATAMDPGFGVPSIFQLADAAGVKYEGKNTDSAKKLLTNPDLNTEFARNYLNAMGKKFGGDPVLMAASYNAGPGAVERAGNQVPNFPETKKYVAGISPERFESASQSVREARRAQMGLPPLPAAPAKAQPIPGAAAAIDQVTDITKRGVAESNQQLMMDMLAGRAPIPKRATPDDETLMREKTPPAMMPKPKEEAAPAAPAAKPEEDSDIAALRRSIASRREELGKQKEQDKYMALLAAGLGMMGGTSRYAAQNIGQGALQGVAALQAARKEQRQAEQDVLASELGLSRATLYEKMRQDQLASNKEIAAGKLAVSQQLAALRQQQGYRDAVDMWNNSSARTALEGALKQEYGKNWQKDDKANLRLQAERNRFIQELLRGGSAAGVPSYAQLMG